jgi:YfiH family protein
MNQTHSDVVEISDGSGLVYDCDALVTNKKGVGLAALAADCMPITFSSPSVVGVAHVGRVGLFKEIAPKTVAIMRELGAVEITATIGPSICGRCYEVSSEMYQESIITLPAAATSDQLHALDLKAGVTFQLQAIGVDVSDVDICTKEDRNYFSFRDGDESARQAGIISL